MVQRKLGRGLDFLIAGTPEVAKDEVLDLKLDQVRPNPFQPRRDFPEKELQELASSILEHGVLQPIVVRPAGDGYELIAGERRFRACESIGRKSVPAIVRAASDTQMLELALVENIQRQDLNPIETAQAYAGYIDRMDLTQEEAARRLGKSRSAIANTLRLLELPRDLQESVAAGRMTGGHARALLGLSDVETQRAVARRVERDGLSVREVERVVRKRSGGSRKAKATAEMAPFMKDIEDRLRQHLGTKVSLLGAGDGGKILIEYYTSEDLSRLVDVLLGPAE